MSAERLPLELWCGVEVGEGYRETLHGGLHAARSHKPHRQRDSKKRPGCDRHGAYPPL